MADNRYYDDLEVRDPAERETALFERLPAHIRNARDNAPYFAKLLADVDPASVTDRAALAALPVTRKSELVNIQSEGDPFGGMTTLAVGQLSRIFQSPGPTYDPEGHGKDWWGTARALYASGFRAGDVMHNTFAYHFTPAGVMLEAGARALGCAVFPAGVGNTELQVQAIHDIKPSGYTGTPSFLKVILEKADEMGRDTSSLKKACVAGEGLPPALRQEIEDHGIHCGQVYATADIGNIGYESEAREGLIVDERLIVEIVRPGTGDPVAEGEVGEVVVTVLRDDYPLIRFATGDLSKLLSGVSPCGRTNMRLAGWMGRADQTTKVKGMFVHPAQVAEIVRRHPEIKRARVVVTHDGKADVMTVKCEVAEGGNALIDSINETVQNVCKLKGHAECVAEGSLPNDGKVIEDAREV
ncbi:MAG: AMP-binding protein [Rhodospirillales bacterium]|nr:AMP-binding protein [Rhodospirillales bacterium]MBO6788181.1 AMP-binding protein [Rhodospirillales bacterium]